jgi:hypothetical protein
VVIGTAVGLLIAFFTTRVLESMLFNISPTDPATFLAVLPETVTQHDNVRVFRLLVVVEQHLSERGGSPEHVEHTCGDKRTVQAFGLIHSSVIERTRAGGSQVLECVRLLAPLPLADCGITYDR